MRNALTQLRAKFASFGVLLRDSIPVKILLAVGLVGVISSLFPEAASHDYEYEVGTIWNEEDLIASFAFPIYRDAEQIEKEYDAARKSTPRSFRRVDTMRRVTFDSARSVLAAYASICDRLIKQNPRQSAASIAVSKLDSLNTVAAQKNIPMLKETGWEMLIDIRRKEGGASPPFASFIAEMDSLTRTRNGSLNRKSLSIPATKRS